MDVALNRCNNSSPGLDKIPFTLIKKLNDNVKIIIVGIVNEFFSTQNFPDEWQKCKVVAILKPDKNPEEASSYRPICLLSCVRKLFEKMLHTRMDLWIEREGKGDPT